MYSWKQFIKFFDDRRDIAVPGDKQDTLVFSVEHFISAAETAIASHGVFSVALSGGSTPREIFQLLSSPVYSKQLNWNQIKLFWSDERCVPPDNLESNFHTAMEAGLASLPIPPENIFRMQADSSDVEQAAKDYEELILKQTPKRAFDLVMLGMRVDAHIASLFPQTHGLHADTRLAIANFVPQKNTWRMSLTFKCINESHHIAIYVMGKEKSAMVNHVLNSPYDPDHLPAQRVGTRLHKALWILDEEAASDLLPSLE